MSTRIVVKKQGFGLSTGELKSASIHFLKKKIFLSFIFLAFKWNRDSAHLSSM